MKPIRPNTDGTRIRGSICSSNVFVQLLCAFSLPTSSSILLLTKSKVSPMLLISDRLISINGMGRAAVAVELTSEPSRKVNVRCRRGAPAWNLLLPFGPLQAPFRCRLGSP
jgi:hypothetical protein